MSYKHMLAIARKEFFHILRDPGTFLLVTLGPVFLMVTFTYTMTADVKNMPVAVIDYIDNEASQEFIQRIDANEVAKITERPDDASELDDLFQHGKITAAIIIPEGFGDISLTGQTTPIEAIIDGTEPVSAEQVLDEVYRIADEYTRELAEAAFAETGLDSSLLDPPIAVEEETLFNSNLRTVVDFYPGLAGMMLGLPAIALAMSLARESEIGTLEQLVASPIDKRALLVGKMLPYLLFGMIDVYVLLVLGWVVYDVPFEGSILAYSLIAFLYMVANLGIGLLIAVLIRSQQLAMIVALLVFFIPPFFLSGLFFPIDAMPWLVQIEMIEFPATHYVAASKAIQLQGASLIDLWFPTLILLILAAEVIEIATFIFRKKVIITFSWKKLFRQPETAEATQGSSTKEVR